MTDRYAHLATPPDPARSVALLDELHARLLEPDVGPSVAPAGAPAGDPGPHPDAVRSLPSYSAGEAGSRARRPHSWRRIAAVAAALVLFVPAVLALTRLGDDGKLETGPTATVDPGEPRAAEVTARIPVAEPLEVKAVGHAVWVADVANHTVSRVDPATNRLVATISAMPTVFRLDATDDAVWIAGADGDPAVARTVTVSRIDPATDEITTILDVPVTGLAGLDVAVTSDAVWVAAGTSVTRIDPATNEITATIPLAARPAYLAATDDAVWVTTLDEGVDQLTRIDPATDRVVATVPGLAGAGDVAATDGAVWVVDAATETLVQVDPASNQIVGRVLLPSGGGALAIGDAVVWALLMDGDLYRVDPATHQATRALGLGLGTDSSLSVTPDVVWTTSVSAGTIVRIDPGTR